VIVNKQILKNMRREPNHNSDAQLVPLLYRKTQRYMTRQW